MEFKNYSKTEVQELVKMVHMGAMIRSSVAESQGQDWKKLESFEQKIYQSIYEAGYTDIIVQFEGILLPNDIILKAAEQVQAEYNEEEFWHELMVQFGKRDFFRTATKQEKQYIEEGGWLPERVHTYYEIYDEEFSEHGIERLEITKD